jgi:hypothetical protein
MSARIFVNVRPPPPDLRLNTRLAIIRAPYKPTRTNENVATYDVKGICCCHMKKAVPTAARSANTDRARLDSSTLVNASIVFMAA